MTITLNNMPVTLAQLLNHFNAPFTEHSRMLLADEFINAGFPYEAVESFVFDGGFSQLEQHIKDKEEEAEEAQALYDYGYEDGVKDAVTKLALIMGITLNTAP